MEVGRFLFDPEGGGGGGEGRGGGGGEVGWRGDASTSPGWRVEWWRGDSPLAPQQAEV